MPAIVAPHRSGVHRVTAIALYRALLSKCHKLPRFPDRESGHLKSVVQNTFKKNRFLESKYELRNAFAGGYEALNHMTAASQGDKSSRVYLKSLLSRLPNKIKTSTSTTTAPSIPTSTSTTSPTTSTSDKSDTPSEPAAPTPIQKPSILSRPRPLFSLPARRRIPILVSANKIPILRFKKPQPASLSHYLKSRLVTRQRRVNRRADLESAILLAKREDEWDDIIARAQQRESGDAASNNAEMKGERKGKANNKGKNKKTERRLEDDMWEKVPMVAWREVSDLLKRMEEKNRVMAERMMGIIDKEKEFAEIERKVRVRERNEMRKRRKAEREGGTMGERGDVSDG